MSQEIELEMVPAWLNLNNTNSFLAHLNETVLPFYILHQTIIILVAYFMVQTTLAIPIKYGITALASLAAILVIYELLAKD